MTDDQSARSTYYTALRCGSMAYKLRSQARSLLVQRVAAVVGGIGWLCYAAIFSFAWMTCRRPTLSFSLRDFVPYFGVGTTILRYPLLIQHLEDVLIPLLALTLGLGRSRSSSSTAWLLTWDNIFWVVRLWLQLRVVLLRIIPFPHPL